MTAKLMYLDNSPYIPVQNIKSFYIADCRAREVVHIVGSRLVVASTCLKKDVSGAVRSCSAHFTKVT